MTDETQSARLSEFNFRVLIDASGSMGTEDCPNGMSRWKYAQENALQIARGLEKIDSDGIDVITFGGTKIVTTEGVTSAKVAEVFTTRDPYGGTPLHLALDEAFKMGKASNKKSFNIVFTDGVPDNEGAVEKLIREQAASQTNDDDCTVLFVQIGNDAHATQYLTKLDDQLTGAKFDIVDRKSMDELEQFGGNVVAMIEAAIVG